MANHDDVANFGASARIIYSLRLPPELHHALKQEAQVQSKLRGGEVSMNNLIIELCRIGVAELREKRGAKDEPAAE